IALQREGANVEERRRAHDRRDLPALEILDPGESRVLARDDGAEHGGGDAGDPEGHAVLERLGGQRERHVDGVHRLRRELVRTRPRRSWNAGVLGLPAVPAEQVLLVDDLGGGPAELEIGEPDLAFSLRPRRGWRGGQGQAALEERPSTDHAFTSGTPRSASWIFSAGYS